MSAFVVSDNHINVLLTFAIIKRASYYWRPAQARMQISADNADQIGQILLEENFRSVNYRYSDSEPPHRYQYQRVRSDNYSAVDVLKAVNCLDYQSCETPDWPDTHAYAILDGIKDRAIRALPGYDDSKGWSL